MRGYCGGNFQIGILAVDGAFHHEEDLLPVLGEEGVGLVGEEGGSVVIL